MKVVGLSPSLCQRILIVLTALISVSEESLEQNVVEKPRESSSLQELLSHPRVSELCAQRFQGYEGVQVKGFTLQKSLVLLTPGLRVPPEYVRDSVNFKLKASSGPCNFRKLIKHEKSLKLHNYAEVLQLKEKIRRKTKKSGLKILKALPDADSCLGGSLSAFGVVQSVRVGEYLGQVYFGKLESLKRMSPYSQLAETVGDENLYQSLNAVLYGLLTEKQFLNADIAKASSNFCPPSNSPDFHCTFQQDIHYYVKQAHERETHLFKDSKVLKYSGTHPLGQKLNIDLTSKDLISYLGCKLCTQHLHGTKVEDLSFSTEDIDEIFQISDSHTQYIASNSLVQSHALDVTSGFRGLLKQWVSDTVVKETNNEDINSVNEEDFKLMLVDDLFLLNILTALNISMKGHIVPLSRFVVEIFEFSIPDQKFQLDKSHVENPQERSHNSVTLIEQGDIHKSYSNSPSLSMSVDANDINDWDTGKDVSGLKIKNQEDIPYMPFQDLLKENDTAHNVPENSSILKVIPSLHSFLPRKINGKLPENLLGDDDTLIADDSIQSQRFVRLLFNGEIITSFIPECESDDMVSLGLCSLATFVRTLEYTEIEQESFREEL